MAGVALSDADRRRCFRARLAEAAMIRSAAHRLACVRTVDDLSLGGAHIVGACPVAVGEAVTASIKLEGRRRIAPRGHVLRCTGEGEHAGFAMVFTDVSPRAEDIIHDFIVHSLEADEVSAVLLIEPDRQSRRELTRLLTQVGYRVMPVATPVEAIDQLTMHATCIQAALVSHRLTQTTGIEFVGFLKDAFPMIRRVLTTSVGSSARARDVRAAGLVHEALSAPWQRGHVSRALGTRRRARAHD